MKPIAITLCLSLLATLITLTKAQALSIHERFMRISYTKMAKFRPMQQIAPTVRPVPQPESTTLAETTPAQPTPKDPRRAPQEPCPACGMG